MSSVSAKHIIIYGSTNMQENDSSTPQGGSINKNVKVIFTDIDTTGSIYVVSDNSSDDQQTILTITGRDASGALISEAQPLSASGTALSVTDSSFERIIKVTVTGSTPSGNLGAFSRHAKHSATLQGGTQALGTPQIKLDSSASGTTDDYKGYVIRMTGGNAVHNVREIVAYNGTTKVASLRTGLSATPTHNDGFSIYPGCVLEKSLGVAGSDITSVRRPFYNVAADPDDAVIKYEKVFVFNLNADTTLSNTTLLEVNEGLYTYASFSMETSLSGSGTSHNRATVPPSGIGSWFDYSDGAQDIPNSKNFTNNAGLGVWLKLMLAAGAAAQNDVYSLQTSGQTT
jgi:hypothetical protein